MSATAHTNFRRGACPGLSTPMQTGDGLLARLMPTGTITLDAMAGLSAAALNYGNRIIEVTSRGSIQVRGLTPESAPAFAEAVAALGIPAHDGVPVIADPLAGLDPSEVIDAGALAGELRMALAGQSFTQQLAPKISIAIDGDGTLHLDSLRADIRLRAVASPDGARFHLAVGGDAATALPLGTVAPADVIDEVLRVLRAVASHGPNARARDVIRTASTDAPAPPRPPVDPIGVHHLRGRTVALGIGLPFGHTDTTILNGLLRAARAAGATGVRTAPGRALLVVGIAQPDIAGFAAAADRLDVITDPRDPRRRVIACAGAPICASGEIEARGLAPQVARDATRLQGREMIHISGCAKMCAYQGDATLTAIGRAGACDLLVDGAPAGRCEPAQLAGRLGQMVVARLQKRVHG